MVNLQAPVFGVFGEGGRALFVNTAPNGWKGTPEALLDEAAGPSVMAGDRLYQVVTDNTGMGASIREINMENLN